MNDALPIFFVSFAIVIVALLYVLFYPNIKALFKGREVHTPWIRGKPSVRLISGDWIVESGKFLNDDETEARFALSSKGRTTFEILKSSEVRAINPLLMLMGMADVFEKVQPGEVAKHLLDELDSKTRELALVQTRLSDLETNFDTKLAQAVERAETLAKAGKPSMSYKPGGGPR